MDPDLSPEHTEKLVQFQELSGIEDLDRCKQLLQRHNWDVETAIHDHLGLDPHERNPPAVNNSPLFRNVLMNGRAPGLVNGAQQQPRNNLRRPSSANNDIMSFFFNPFGGWPITEQRPTGFTGWVLFLTSLPIRVVIATFYQITNFVFRLLRPIHRPDPAGTVVSFIQEYERTYGDQHPHFYPGTYSQVLNEAKKELKFLLVYLHCKDHQHTDRFCRQTLSDPRVIEYVNENCIMWACSVDTTEGYRVSQSLRENTYPFLAIIVQRDFKMTVVGRIEGFVEPEALVRRIGLVVTDNEAFLVVARADRDERSFTQALRQEQDQAYLESLKADQEKEEKKRRDKLLEEERLREIRELEEEEQRKRDELKQRKLDAVNHVPPEPSHDSDGICRILVRLPSGQKLERRFHRTIHTLKDLYYFILSHPDSPYQFEMATSFPKRTLQWDPRSDIHPTLAEVGLGASEALLVLDLDA